MLIVNTAKDPISSALRTHQDDDDTWYAISKEQFLDAQLMPPVRTFKGGLAVSIPVCKLGHHDAYLCVVPMRGNYYCRVMTVKQAPQAVERLREYVEERIKNADRAAALLQSQPPV